MNHYYLVMSQKKKIDNYLVFLDKKIGQGSFGSVYVGEQDKTNLRVAVKMLDKKLIDKDEYIKNALLAEISILKSLKNVNIVGFLDVMESANYYYIVQEYCDGEDLRALIKKRGPLLEAEAIHILTEICNGFVAMIQEGVIHRDLKPENVLIHKGVAKICDFGFSKKESSKKMKHNSIVGTPLYMSLQILKSMPYTSKCDIWALGFIFYELLHKVTPWDATSEYQLIQNIQKQPLQFPKNLAPATKDFLIRCLQPLQKDRISWDQLLRHEIFKGLFSSYVNKEHEFENKFKYLMGQIRYKINSQNINLERLFERHGYHKNTELKFEHFDQFMKTIDSSLTQEEERYIFQKLDTNESNSISLGELEAVMISNNIQMAPCFKPPERKISMNSEGMANEGMSNEKFQQTTMKIINAFNKLAQKMHKNNISLLQVFEAYDIDKDGDITIKEFSRILTKLDSSLTEEEIKLGFTFVDTDHSNQITFRQFLEYFCKCTGEPINNHMSMRTSK